MKAQLRRDVRQIMWKQAFLKESATWRKDADLLLANSKIIGLLGEYGRVVLAGSYRLSLMMSGDIDIKVINSKLEKRSVVETLNRLIRQDFFDNYLFGDWAGWKRPLEGRDWPKGYYVGLKRNHTRLRGRNWKVDVWFVRKQDGKELKLMNFIQQKLDYQSRLTILKFKKLKETRELQLSGTKIYDLVLREKVASTNEFLRLAKK